MGQELDERERQEEAAAVLCKMAMQAGPDDIIAALHNRPAEALLLLMQDALDRFTSEGAAVGDIVAKQRTRLSLCSKTFFRISQSIVESGSNPTLTALLDTQEEHWQRVIHIAGNVLSPPAKATDDPAISHWREFVVEHQPIRKTFEQGLYNFLESTTDIRVAAMQALLRIAKANWDRDGIEILKRLVAIVVNNSVWLLTVPRRKLDFQRILQLALALLSGTSFEDGTDVVIVFLRSFCLLNGEPVQENQDRILEMWSSLNHSMEGGSGHEEGKLRRSHIFFRMTKDGSMEVSATTATRRKLWRSLKVRGYLTARPRFEARDVALNRSLLSM
jgi:hypothetical protein